MSLYFLHFLLCMDWDIMRRFDIQLGLKVQLKLNVETEYGVYSNFGYVQTIKKYFGDNTPIDNYINNKQKR